MTTPAVQRAVDYIAIFVGLGDNWEYCAPLDATRTPTGIRLDGIEIGPDPEQPGVWWLDDGTNPRKHYRKASA